MSQFKFIILTFLFALISNPSWSLSPEDWKVFLGPQHRDDEAIRVALEDLQNTGQSLGLHIEIAEEGSAPTGNFIVVGDPERNPLTGALLPQQGVTLQNLSEPEGFEIRTFQAERHRTLFIAGGSIIGDVRGLYWLWDRIRVHKEIPDLNEVRIPDLNLRVDAPWGRHSPGGRSEQRMRNSLRHGFNWVAGPSVLELVPWDSEPEATQNARNREEARELIDYAHSLHMKMFSFSHGFAYHPSLLKETGATLSPCDPTFWKAVRTKYRKLLNALPELDGIEICNDDLSGFWDDYRIYDLLHESPDCGWSYTKRFREFVKTIHEVVVDEFGKEYFHFTWSLVLHELTKPEVHREIFTDEIPTENFHLVPKITTADRWWHQPYNPTFNLTPHKAIVRFEPMNYYEGGKAYLFPTFSGQYFQAGLQTFLMPDTGTIEGVGLPGGYAQDRWGTYEAYGYVLYRLQWDPDESIEQIAKDFCSIHFGPEIAEAMAEICLLSPRAYKYGLHIEPVSYGQYNSFIHMRVGTFPEMGIPAIDRGREHLEFWKRIYLRCKPWKEETLQDLHHGLAIARDMKAKFQFVQSKFTDADLARDVENRLNMTNHLIETNIQYVRMAFSLFEFLDDPNPESRAILAEVHEDMLATRKAFVEAPGFGYKLFGVDLLIRKAAEALEDPESVQAILDKGPTRAEIEETVSGQQALYRELLEEYKEEAVLFGEFEGQIDGNDILIVSGTETEIQHMRWDHPHIDKLEILRPIPNDEVTVIIRDLESRPLHPFVLEQPNEENDYTTQVYFEDEPGGQGVVHCEFYYIHRPPSEVGLSIPWINFNP